MLTVTTNDIPGYRITKVLGLVRGLSVRSRSLAGNIRGTLQLVKGGNIGVYTELAETTRQEAFDLMLTQARELGGNAIVAMRYDANEINSVVTEVLAYGTAVVIEPMVAQS